jgi:hypothetical protein
MESGGAVVGGGGSYFVGDFCQYGFALYGITRTQLLRRNISSIAPPDPPPTSCGVSRRANPEGPLACVLVPKGH